MLNFEGGFLFLKQQVPRLVFQKPSDKCQNRPLELKTAEFFFLGGDTFAIFHPSALKLVFFFVEET